jgi:hypothetical protein
MVLKKQGEKSNKKCNSCEKTRDFSEFYKDSSKKHSISTFCKECVLKKVKGYYVKNKKKCQENHKKWVEKNKTKYLTYLKEYRSVNKDYLNQYERERSKTDINFKMLKNLRSRLRSALKNNQKTGSAIESLGCTIEDLKKHIESQFKEGMNWNNHGYRGWHIDHIQPLSSFDLTDKEQLLKACHFSNLQPLWAKENLKKSNKVEKK